MLYADASQILPVLEVTLHLLVSNAPAPFEDLAAENQQQTPSSVPLALACGPHRPAGLAAH